MGEKAAIYTRISRDIDDEEHEEARKEKAGELSSALGKSRKGVRRQSEDCHTLAVRRGYSVVGVFEDNDISASTRSKKPRPQYELLLAAVRRGEVDVIVAYSNSRLTRRPRELEDLIDLHAQTGVTIHTVVSGSDDLATADGRFVARVKGAADAAEAERTAERVKRSKRQKAEEGGYRGGPRPYGYEKDGLTIRESEAQVIRDATKAVLSGRSLSGIAHELNEKGRLTSTGKPWTYMRVRDVLIRPRNAGLVHRGRADRRFEGREDRPSGFELITKAQWPAIVDEDSWRACSTLLLDPARRVHTSTEPRWLGSRSYICGIEGCGALMRPTSTVDHEPECTIRNVARVCGCGRRYYYRCSDRNHLTVAAKKTDDFVRDVVAIKLQDPRVIAALSQSRDDTLGPERERRTVLTARLKQLAAEWDEDLIDTRDYNRKKDKAEAELAEIAERLAVGVQQTTVSPILNAVDPAAAFRSAPVDVQRAVLRSVLTVTVKPRAALGVKWSSDRLQIVPALAEAV